MFLLLPVPINTVFGGTVCPRLRQQSVLKHQPIEPRIYHVQTIFNFLNSRQLGHPPPPLDCLTLLDGLAAVLAGGIEYVESGLVVVVAQQWAKNSNR